jgi:hypothetical protein
MSEPRKASDILLSLEEKVNSMVKIISVYDMNMKLILDRVNKIYKYIEMLEQEAQQEQGKEPAIEYSVDNPIIVADSTAETIMQRRGVRVEVPVEKFDPQVPAVPEKRVVDSGNSDKKVPVIQRVTDHTGKDLFMAEVTILNDNKELVLKTKTNAAGKWQAYLKQGQYSVNIVKTDTATKKKIEALQDINVSDSMTTITLPTAIIKR